MTEDLVDLADHLARFGRGRPRRVSLRRAVGTAYYALFHAVARTCANTLLGAIAPWDAYTPVYRSLEHSGVRGVFDRARGGRLLGPEVDAIGGTFIVLQDARHTADYDPVPFAFTRRETLDLIDQTRQAIEALRSLDPATRLKLAALLIAGGGRRIASKTP